MVPCSERCRQGMRFSKFLKKNVHILFQCIQINPTWSKGYARKGAALHGSKSFDEAIAAYEAGLKIEDSAPLKKGLQEVKDAQGKRRHGLEILTIPILSHLAFDGTAQRGANPFASMFADPNLIGRLATNPRTSKHLSDPSFVQKVCLMSRIPRTYMLTRI